MESVLAKVMVMGAAHITDMDVNHVHRNYKLPLDVKALMFLHHLIITMVVLGIFLTSKKFIRMHLVATAFIFILWFSFDGCVLTFLQKELINYFPGDCEAIHGTYTKQAREQFVIGGSIILYDFYKLLV
jgi:hypothetical protein